jgi:hypothetical protein
VLQTFRRREASISEPAMLRDQVLSLRSVGIYLLLLSVQADNLQSYKTGAEQEIYQKTRPEHL